jgi:hypothetical protein
MSIRETETGNQGAELWVLTECSWLFSRRSKIKLRARPAERRIAQPQLRAADSRLRVKQRVLRFANGNGIW